ncbi:MAG: NUDIX domain-containing protein [Bacteroidales bacterium]|nr:NUDIX domain-containing protein [Bacteroidales bacterium]
MIELVYPVEGTAPEIPSPKAADVENPRAEDAREEWFPVVEPTGEVVGISRRSYCHGGSMVLHPVVHLHILDRQGRLYLQRRALDKDLLPGCWDTAVGGHVAYGEHIMEALYRESGEELGFTEYNPVHICTYIFESARERELVSVFAAVGSSFVLRPDPSELMDGRFWTMEEIVANMGNGTFTPNFESEYRAVSKQLYALL